MSGESQCFIQRYKILTVKIIVEAVEICTIMCNLGGFWAMAHALFDFRLLMDEWSWDIF